jgi:hypothetical protein
LCYDLQVALLFSFSFLSSHPLSLSVSLSASLFVELVPPIKLDLWFIDNRIFLFARFDLIRSFFVDLHLELGWRVLRSWSEWHVV